MNGTNMNATANIWYILRGDEKSGPYDYKSIIRMLQTSDLFEYSYVWAPHLESWNMISDLPEFSKDRFCRIIESKSELNDAFIKRSTPRRELRTEVIVHDNNKIYSGHTISLSLNGGLLHINDPLLVPNQKIMIHFRKSETCPTPFNAVCEILRKNFTKNRLNVKSGLQYVVRFIEIQEIGKTQILNWTRVSVNKEENNGIY